MSKRNHTASFVEPLEPRQLLAATSYAIPLTDPPEAATPTDRFVVGGGAMLHRYGADSTVASGRLRLIARGAALRRIVDFLQRGPTILPRRHSGASRKIPIWL